VSIVLGVTLGHLPLTTLIGLLTLIIAIHVSIGVYRSAESVEKLVPFLGLNVIINIVTPTLVAIGLFLG
jgi:1,4-dihydroxy-2-naphthoate octaprenyltransferase